MFMDSKITADGDCSHEIKRHLLLERKAMTNLDSPQPNDYPHCLFFSPFQSQIFGGAAHLHLLVSPALSLHQAHSRLHGNPSHEGLHVASSASNGSFQPFQGFSELPDTLSVALSCLESSIVGSPFVNPGSPQAPLPQPFQHFQY